jgi:hypothetical protein
MKVAVNFTPQQLYLSGNNPEYPLKRMLGGCQIWPGRFAEDKNPLPLM